MAIHRATRHLVGVALALVSMSCAVQTVDAGDEPAVEDSATVQPLPPPQPPDYGESACSPLPGIDAQGHLYVKGYICPPPERPLPDPPGPALPQPGSQWVQGNMLPGSAP